MSRATEEALEKILDILLEDGDCRFIDFNEQLEGTSRREIAAALKLGQERLIVVREGEGRYVCYFLNKSNYIKYMQEEINKLSEKLKKAGWTCRA